MIADPKKGFPEITVLTETDLNSPHRELSNGGLKSVVAPLVRWQINFLSARIGRSIQLYPAICSGEKTPLWTMRAT